MKRILDACCGSRMFWFNKHNPDTVYMDNREIETELQDGRKLVVAPDIIGDFTDMPFHDESFYLVVFDPPHLLRAGEKSWLALKYGKLPKDWKPLIKKGFSECMRVLKPNGTLIFKWSDDQICVSDVLKILPTPLFGSRRGKSVFLVYMRNNKDIK